LAELTRAYSNFSLPELHTFRSDSKTPAPTLVDQAAGLSALLPAVDHEPATKPWRSTKPFQADVIRLYQQGRSLTSISRELGIAWESVARLLESAGLRERRRHPSE
jgi:hypothetical protein